MKIKIYKSPIFNLIVFVTILDSGLLTLINMPYLKEDRYSVLITVILAIALFFNCIINKNINKALSSYRTFLNFYLLMWIVFIAVFLLFSYNKYGQGMVELYNCFRYYLYFFWVYPLIYLFTRQNGYENLLKALVLLTLIILALKLAHALIYNFTGRELLQNIPIAKRYNRLRIGVHPLFSLALIYSIFSFFREKLVKNKIKWLAVIAFIYLFEFYVNMTRGYIVAIILTTMFMVLLKPRNKSNQVLTWLTVAVIIGILYYTGAISSFLDSFSDANDETGRSTLARQIAIDYYSQYPKNNPVFGMGFVCPTNDYFTAIFRGPDFTCSFDDLGIVNMWYHYGIIGVVVTAITFIRIFYLFIRIYYFSNSPNKLMFAGMIVYFISTQASLSVLDGQRMLTFVLFWSMFEYEAKQISPRKRRQITRLTGRGKKSDIKDRIKISL